jgi:hypothetical protein
LNSPVTIAFDAVDNLYIAEEQAYRIRKVDRTTQQYLTITSSAGQLLTTVGNGDTGAPSTGRFGNLRGLLFVPSTNRLYAADNVQHRVRVIQ